MRFFSRIVLICNCCFIIAVILRYVELVKRVNGNFDSVIPLPPLESIMVTLGLLVAILINTTFVFLCLYLLATKKIKLIPRWIVLFNLLIFPVQVWYHFFLH